MNLVLLKSEGEMRFEAGSPAAEHLTRVLKVGCGSTFWCGVKNGRRGLATISDIAPDGSIAFSVAWENAKGLTLPPVRLLVGLSRPQTMKKIFACASEIGCARIDVFRSGKGDPAYAESSLWKIGDTTLSGILQKSAEQTCVPAVPEFSLWRSLEDFFSEGKISSDAVCVALDVYAEQKSFAELVFPPGAELLLAIGPERGWTDTERNQLRENGFAFAHLGERVLRVETAVSVALAVALAKINFWKAHRVIT